MVETASDQVGASGSGGAHDDFDVSAVKEAKSLSTIGVAIGGGIAAVLFFLGLIAGPADTGGESAEQGETVAAEEPMATEEVGEANAMAEDLPVPESEAAQAVAPAADLILWGSDSSQYANDGECDDPRFVGDGMASSLYDENIGRDASDCRVAYGLGLIGVR